MRALVGGAHDDQKGTALGIVTTTSETAFSHATETIYGLQFGRTPRP